MTNKRRLTSAQVKTMIEQGERRNALLERRLRQLGVTPTEPDPSPPITVGTTIDLYGNGQMWVYTEVDTHTGRSTLEEVADPSRPR